MKMLVLKILIVAVVICVLAFAAQVFLAANDSDNYCIEIVQRSSKPCSPEKMKEIVKAAWGKEPSDDPRDEIAMKLIEDDDKTLKRYLLKCKNFGFGITYDSKPYPFDDKFKKVEEPKLKEVNDLNRSFCEIAFVNTPSKPSGSAMKYATQLVRQLVDEDTLAIFPADFQNFNPVTDEVRNTLNSDDAAKVITSQIYMPMTKVSHEHMEKTMEQAQKSFSVFESAFSKKSPEDSLFTVKFRIEDKNGPEHVWLSVKSIENDSIDGEIGNEPVIATSYQKYQKVSMKLSEVEDWMYRHGSEIKSAGSH